MNEEIILSIFAERLTELIKETNLDIEFICKKVGIKSKSTMYRYMKGEMSPKISTVKYLSEIFNVNPVWLSGYDVPKQRIKLDKLGNPVTSIPLLGTVKAGYDYLAQENWIGTVDVDKKLVRDGSDFFALKVKGDSMYPSLIEDDIVIVQKQNDFENGDIVVAIINGDEATIKKGKKTDSSILLQPLNAAYEPLIFTYNEVKSIPVIIIGIVKQLKREF